MDDTILEHLTPNVQRRKKRSLLRSALSWFTEGSSAGKAVSPIYYISSFKRSEVETCKWCTQSVFKHKSKQIILWSKQGFTNGKFAEQKLHSYLLILSLNNENSLKLPQSATNPLALFNFIYIKTYRVPRPKCRINSFTIHILHDRSKEAYLLT